MAGRHRKPDPAHTRRWFLRYGLIGTAAVTVGTGSWASIRAAEVDTPTGDSLAGVSSTTAAPTSTNVLAPPVNESPNVTAGPSAPVNTADPQPSRTPVQVPEVNKTPVNACSPEGWGLKPHAARATHQIAAVFGLKTSDVGGYRASSAIADSDHPKHLAADFMVSSKAEGDRIAAYVLKNWKLYSASYMIWYQRISLDGVTWSPMVSRGSITADHKDHVHLSFKPTGSGYLITC